MFKLILTNRKKKKKTHTHTQKKPPEIPLGNTSGQEQGKKPNIFLT